MVVLYYYPIINGMVPVRMVSCARCFLDGTNALCVNEQKDQSRFSTQHLAPYSLKLDLFLATSIVQLQRRGASVDLYPH